MRKNDVLAAIGGAIFPRGLDDGVHTLRDAVPDVEIRAFYPSFRWIDRGKATRQDEVIVLTDRALVRCRVKTEGFSTVDYEVDTAPEGLEHNVAKYVWFADRAGPFWRTPAILVSAFAMRAPRDYMLHQNVAAFLGRLLQERVPETAHALVDLRADPDSELTGERLAELAFEKVREWVGDL
jgi:hypothetical protein